MLSRRSQDGGTAAEAKQLLSCLGVDIIAVLALCVGSESSCGLMSLLALCMVALALQSWHTDSESNETLALAFINGSILSLVKVALPR